MILARAGLTIGLVAPWGGFPHHKTTLRNLTRQLDYMMKQTGQGLTRLKASLVSLANCLFFFPSLFFVTWGWGWGASPAAALRRGQSAEGCPASPRSDLSFPV